MVGSIDAGKHQFSELNERKVSLMDESHESSNCVLLPKIH